MQLHISVKPLWLFVIVAIVFVVRLFFAHATVTPEAASILKKWISAEYVQYHVDRKDISLKEKADILREAKDVQFRSIDARGTAGNMVFRVEIEPSDAHPPDQPTVRYFRMEYSLMLGWYGVPRPSSALFYFLALFML